MTHMTHKHKVLRRAKTKGNKYVLELQQTEDKLCDLAEYVNGELQVRRCNRTETQARHEFQVIIVSSRLYDGINYIIEV